MQKYFLISLTFLCTCLSAQNIGLVPFVSGLDFPVEIAHANDSRLFIAQKGGSIKIATPEGNILPQDFLNISQLISTESERGLLGLAFHPNYSQNGFFYVYYSDAEEGNAIVARYTVSDENPNVADPDSAFIILTVIHGGLVHYGGCIKFGPDGLIYIGIGDGGAAIDADNPAQNVNINLGKILRLNVDVPAPFIPLTNPFASVEGLDEIWASGVRNPWKFSFDRLTGDMWLTDVGHTDFEEINKLEQPLVPAMNFGWPCYEAFGEIVPNSCSSITTNFPDAYYDHLQGCSIIGGYVYRGNTYPAFSGKYFFTDFCSQKIGILNAENEISFTNSFTDYGFIFITMGEDANGELYVGSNNSIYKIVEQELGTVIFETNEFTITPNPSANLITFKGLNLNNSYCNIFDLTNKKIFSTKFNFDENLMDISFLQQGLYIVNVTTDSGNTYIAKLIKK